MNLDRILVRATNWVGDAVMSLPALQALRASYPSAHIAVLARPWVADLYRREPFCDELIPYTSPKGWRGLRDKWTLARDLPTHRFDAAILLQNAFEAAALVFAAGIPQRIGYRRDGRGILLTKSIPVPRPGEIPAHQRFYYLELLRRAGLIETYPSSVTVALSGSAEARVRGRVLLAEQGLVGPLIGLSPGAAFGGAKRWLPERFAETAILLAGTLGASVAIFGSEAEKLVAGQIASSIEEKGFVAKNLAGRTTLGTFIEMAAACDAFVTNDSGGMHIASALGVPTVAVFGPTDENATGPAGTHSMVIRRPVDCSPCHLRECPIDHRCMTGVSAKSVADSVLSLLK